MSLVSRRLVQYIYLWAMTVRDGPQLGDMKKMGLDTSSEDPEGHKDLKTTHDLLVVKYQNPQTNAR